jgi:hypothetical protein
MNKNANNGSQENQNSQIFDFFGKVIKLVFGNRGISTGKKFAFAVFIIVAASDISFSWAHNQYMYTGLVGHLLLFFFGVWIICDVKST